MLLSSSDRASPSALRLHHRGFGSGARRSSADLFPSRLPARPRISRRLSRAVIASVSDALPLWTRSRTARPRDPRRPSRPPLCARAVQPPATAHRGNSNRFSDQKRSTQAKCRARGSLVEMEWIGGGPAMERSGRSCRPSRSRGAASQRLTRRSRHQPLHRVQSMETCFKLKSSRESQSTMIEEASAPQTDPFSQRFRRSSS